MMSRLSNLSSISAMINDSEYCLCPQFFGEKRKIKWRAFIIKYIYIFYMKRLVYISNVKQKAFTSLFLLLNIFLDSTLL